MKGSDGILLTLFLFLLMFYICLLRFYFYKGDFREYLGVCVSNVVKKNNLLNLLLIFFDKVLLVRVRAENFFWSLKIGSGLASAEAFCCPSGRFFF